MKVNLLTLSVTSVIWASSTSAFDPADLERLRTTNTCVECDLSGADLKGADLEGADLTGADLKGADLVGGAWLNGANFTDADLSGANFADAELIGTIFKDAKLTDANLTGADLWNANLRGANLEEANLSKASLTNADLMGAKLSGTDFTDAWLDGVNLCNTILDNCEKWYSVFRKTDDVISKELSHIVLLPKGYTSYDAPAYLIVACDGAGSADIILRVPYDLPFYDKVDITYRFGNEYPRTESWDEKSYNEAQLPKSYTDFKKRLASGEDFVFEYPDFDKNNQLISKFDNNADEILSFAMNGCK